MQSPEEKCYVVIQNCVATRVNKKEHQNLRLGTLVYVHHCINDEMVAVRIDSSERLNVPFEEYLWECPIVNILPFDDSMKPYILAISSPKERVELVKSEELCQVLTRIDVGNLVNLMPKKSASSTKRYVARNVKRALVKYKGPVHQMGLGIYFGIEILESDPTDSDTCDGSWSGSTYYFSCPPGCGKFVAINRLQPTSESPHGRHHINKDSNVSHVQLGRRELYPFRSCAVQEVRAKFKKMSHTSPQPSQTELTAKLIDISPSRSPTGVEDQPLKIGERVVWFGDSGQEHGVVRWLGLLDNSKDLHAGVEFENPVGKCNGSYNGKQLFHTKRNHGRFVPVLMLMKADDLYEHSSDLYKKKKNTQSSPPVSPSHKFEIQPTPCISSSLDTCADALQPDQMYSSPKTKLSDFPQNNSARDGFDDSLCVNGCVMSPLEKEQRNILINTHDLQKENSFKDTNLSHGVNNSTPVSLKSYDRISNKVNTSGADFSDINLGKIKNVTRNPKVNNTHESLLDEAWVGNKSQQWNNTNKQDFDKNIYLVSEKSQVYNSDQSPSYSLKANDFALPQQPLAMALEDIPVCVLTHDWYRDEEQYQAWRRECAVEASSKLIKEGPQYSSLQSSPHHSLKGSSSSLSPFYRQTDIDTDILQCQSPTERCYYDSEPPQNYQGLYDSTEVSSIQPDLGIGSVVEVLVHGEPLYGVIRWIGTLPDDKKNRKVAGVEMEEERSGFSDGSFHGHRYFECNPRKALFVNISMCQKDGRFQEHPTSSIADTKLKTFGQVDCPVIPGVIRPVVVGDDLQTKCGKFHGIQGHHNSCYLDATLFSMFTFTSVFDSLLYRPPTENDCVQYEEVQRVLREEIVNPLRANLFVRADRVMKLRTLLENHSSVSGLTSEEKDPEEFLNSLIAQILRAEPFLKLSSGQEAYYYQLFVEKDEQLKLPSVQKLFEQSFLASDIKLKEVPSCLIIQMPRFGKSFKMYPRILPSQLLDVTDVIEDSPRQCTICGELAEFECKECMDHYDVGLENIAYCEPCLKTAHNHQRRVNHTWRHLSVPSDFKSLQEACSTIPRLYMELFAVVCIETSHYVAFVKCGSGSDAPWCFFDSMADRKGEQNGYNIPEMVPCPDLPYWLSDKGAQSLMDVHDNRQLPEHAKRLFCDAYMCMYQSSDAMMYRLRY